MAYSVDWNTLVITIPKADTTLVAAGPPEIRALSINDLWTELHAIQQSEQGIVHLDIFLRRPARTLAGVTYAPELEIINGYTLEFEDGQYAVNVIDGNSNVSDVQVRNQVGVNTANSAGFAVAAGAAATAEAVWKHLIGTLTAEQRLALAADVLAGKSSGGRTTPRYRNVEDTLDRLAGVIDPQGNRTSATIDLSDLPP